MNEQQKELKEILDEIDERASKVTPGPWHVASTPGNPPRYFVQHEWDVCEVGPYNAEVEEDANFIAAARTDNPLLVKALRRAIQYAQSSMLESEIKEILEGKEA